MGLSIKPFPVALRKESVDRNYNAYETINRNRVALRKESVDRNSKSHRQNSRRYVALRKESVDRNMRWVAARINTIASLSARRAWIEIAFAY